MNSSERTQYSSDLLNYGTSSAYYGQYDTFIPYYGQAKYMSLLYALTGQAIYNEYPIQAETFITRSIAIFNRINSARKEISGDGYPYPLGQTQYYDESGLMPPLILFSSLKYSGLSGGSISSLDDSYVKNTPYGELYASIKNNYLISHDDGYNQQSIPIKNSRNCESAFFSAALAKEYEGQEVGKLINYLQGKYQLLTTELNYRSFEYIGNVIFNNKIINDVGSGVTNLPNTKHFQNSSVVVYRSGWGNLESDQKELYADFYAPPQVNGHTHYSKGHFDIWRGYDYGFRKN